MNQERIGEALWSADVAYGDPKEDLFGYAPFAEHLAQGICNQRNGDSVVVAIYGPWGSGKTTVLKYVRYYIEQKPEHERPIIVSFNPWWFSGQENLALMFLAQLRAALPDRLAGARKIGNLLGEYAKEISRAVTLVSPWAGNWVGWLLRLGGGKPKGIADTKEKVSELLRKMRTHVLVLVDDVDRLMPDETCQLFTVIKALADFPNVVYLLALDRKIAVDAINQKLGPSGEQYLDKIIQVPFELPALDRLALRKVLFSQLEANGA
ncbi:MAG: KAP family P-loop NTPase fold protein [Acidiferrobacterales bacterium]